MHTCNPHKTSVHGNKSRNILLLITFVSYRPFCKISSEVIDLTRYNYKTALIFHLLPPFPPPPPTRHTSMYTIPPGCTDTDVHKYTLLLSYSYCLSIHIQAKRKEWRGGGEGGPTTSSTKSYMYKRVKIKKARIRNLCSSL